MANPKAQKQSAAPGASTNLNPQVKLCKELIELGIDAGEAWASISEEARQSRTAASEEARLKARTHGRRQERQGVMDDMRTVIKTTMMDVLEVRVAMRQADLAHELAKAEQVLGIERLGNEASLTNAKAHLGLAKEFGIELSQSELKELIFSGFELAAPKASGGVVASTETEVVEQSTDYDGNLKRTVTTSKEVYVEEVEDMVAVQRRMDALEDGRLDGVAKHS